MAKKSTSDYQISPETQQAYAAFDDADTQLKQAIATFEERHASEVGFLEQLRERRNNLLAEAKSRLREEAQRASYQEVRSLSIGVLTAVKKWSNWYDPGLFEAIAREKGIYEKLVEEGIIKELIEVGAGFKKDKFENVKRYLKEQKLDEDFAPAEDGGEASPAVTGADQVAGIMTEFKSR